MNQPIISRMSGAGNTFLIWNAMKHPIPQEARASLARLMCEGYHGFQTDGFVFLQNTSDAQCDFEWDFYNSDGSEAEMCGNAARCVALYYFQRINSAAHGVLFNTRRGHVRARLIDEADVEVILPQTEQTAHFVQVKIGKSIGEFFFVNTGVPHVVVESAPDDELAILLRRAPELGPAGANVTFVNEVSPGEIEAVTFERGVENFTLACGTGAIAAAQFSLFKNPILKNHSVEMPGGLLRVTFNGPNEATLCGPAQFEFDILFPEDS